MSRQARTFSKFAGTVLAALLASALAVGQSASRSPASVPTGVTGQMQTINGLLRSGQRAEALTRMDALRTERGLTPRQRFALAWLYGRLNEFKTALTILQSLPAQQPNPRERSYAIALCQFNLKQYDAAIQTLRGMQAQGIADQDAIQLLAVSYDQAGQPGQAYSVLRTELLQHPGDLNGYLNLITLCVNHHNNELAIKVATTGLNELPNSFELYSSRAAALSLQGKQTEAIADYRAAIRLQPRRADDYFSLALIQYHQGAYAATAQTLKTAIDGGFADSDVHYLLAECIRAQHGPIDAARKEVTLALQMDAASAPALTLRGQLELQQGDTAAAVRDLTQARAIDPQSKEVAYNLARAYQKAGQRQKAQALFQQVQAESRDLNAALQQKKMVQILVERPAKP